MFLRAFSCVFFIFIGSITYAAECNQDTLAKIRELGDTHSVLTKTLRKMVARADGQMLRQMALPAAVTKDIPPLPATPVLPDGLFDPEGQPLVACDAQGNAAAELAAFETKLAEAKVQVTAFSKSVKSRGKQVAAAEDTAAAGNDTAEAPDSNDAADGADTAEAPDSNDAADGADTAEAPDSNDAADGADTAEAPDSNDAATDTPDTAEGAAPADPADPADKTARREPMADPGNENLFRRVISLPNAKLFPTTSDSDAGTDLPVFSVLYVFEESQANGQSWLQVGSGLRDDTSNWVKADETLAWSSMLVMSFAPRGSRSQVLFFKDETTLADMVNSPYFSSEANDIYDRLRAEKEKLADDPSYSPSWSPELVAIEPETAVTFDNQPYLLPILDWREEVFDGADETVLLKVAAVPADATSVSARDTDSFKVSAEAAAAASDGVFRVGVTFVIDTTVSMRPFIDRTYQTVEGFYSAFQQFETAENVSFGLVGFRDNVDHNTAGLEYITRIFQPLDIEADSRTLLAKARQMQEAQVPTKGFKEDSFAGMATAINDMDWDPYDARLMVLVTDASAREGDDPLAALRNTNAAAVADAAIRNNIAIVVLHLKTPANTRDGDFARAQHQYQSVSQTGNTALDKYFSLDATSDAEFARELELVSQTMAESVFRAASGQMVSSIEEMEPIPEGGEGRVAAAIRNEIFRAQLESLANVDGGDAPSFLAGWATDKDLTEPERRALNVSVFLTRNQLSSLDKQLDLIVQAFRSGGDDPQAFFQKLQVLAAEMSTDPDKALPEGKDIVRALLPSFLANLPYRSQVLRLDREYWSSISVANRQEFIESIEAKQTTYANIFNQTDKWIDFGADDPGLEATPIPLVNLP